MGKSVRILGQEYGLTSEEMNYALKEEGFLGGEPGNYTLTEKGAEYGEERTNSNGYGGSAQRTWYTKTWNDSILNKLNLSPERIAEIREEVSEARRERRATREAAAEAYWMSFESDDEMDEPEYGGNHTVLKATLAVVGLGLAGLGVYKLSKHLKNRRIKKAEERLAIVKDEEMKPEATQPINNQISEDTEDV
jgi:hypothetical protein